MDTFTIVCPCLFGVESVLKGEMIRLGFADVKAADGRVSCTGDIETVAKANIGLFTAERVLIELGQFRAMSFEDLFQGVLALPLEHFIGRDDRFPVTGYSISSQLKSVPDCQSIIKKAAVKRLQKTYHLEHFPETGALYQLRFGIHKDVVSLWIDTTGTPLHKRGYRKLTAAAPLRETLAAGIVDLARVRRDSLVVDPLCGSGTFLVESALKARRIAPGLSRDFNAQAFGESWAQAFADERNRAATFIDENVPFHAWGYDADPHAVELAHGNVALAKLGDCIEVAQRELRDFAPSAEGYTVLANPPYGERLSDLESARALYREMGRVLKSAKSAYIITQDDLFEEYYGRRATKKRKLYNGMIKCTLYMYY